jgi:PST family polysaccharide transporter
LHSHDVEAELRTDHLVDDAGRRGVRGGALSLSAQLAKLLVQISTVIILTRLLSPSAFGLIAMVSAISLVLDLVKELGLSASTIRKSDITHEQVSTLFWLNTLAGLCLTLMLFGAAPLIAAFYHQPALVSVTRVLSITFALTGVCVQHWALLRRQMRFGAVIFVDVGGEVVGFAIALTLAFAGFGIWALVAQRLASPAFAGTMCWLLCRWRPGAPSLAEGTRELFNFGAAVSGVNVASCLARSVDQVLIGWYWGPAILGLYDRASRLLIAPLNNFSPPLYAVAMPTFSRIAHQRERYRLGFRELLEKVAMVMMPGAALVAVCADWVVRILFGPQWGATTPLVACFATALIYQPLIQVVGLLYLTQDRAREMVRAALIDTTLCILAVAAALPFGAYWVAASVAATGLIVRLPVAFWLASRRGAVRFTDLASTIGPAAFGTVTAVVSGYLARRIIVSSLPPIFEIAFVIGIGAAACVTAFLLLPQSRGAMKGFGAFARVIYDRPRAASRPDLRTLGETVT